MLFENEPLFAMEEIKMKLAAKCLSFFLLCIFALPALADITIYLDGKYIVSSESRQIAVKDTVCNQDKGQFTLQGNQRIAISVCQNSSGYGRVEYRNVTNNSAWVGSSFLHDGDAVSP